MLISSLMLVVVTLNGLTTTSDSSNFDFYMNIVFVLLIL